MPVVPRLRLLGWPLSLWLLPAALSAAVVCNAADAPSSTAAVPLSEKADPRMVSFDKLLSDFVSEHKLPGVALAVTRNGRLIYAQGAGYADIEAGTLVKPDSLFRIASISKPITAVAVLQLVEQGKLGLDEPAFERFAEDPELRPHGAPDARLAQVTIRQLLRHTAGWDSALLFDPMFRSVEIARELNAEPPAGAALVIRYMSGKALDFNPGERYAYSNFGYCVLGRLIEKASGQSYEEYVMEHVLAPRGITRMRIGKTLLEGRADGEVKYYEADKVEPAVLGNDIGKDVPLPYGAWYHEAMDSHGGWIGSAIDLVRFASAFDDPARSPLLTAASIDEMFARPEGLAGHDAEGKPTPAYYALGWSVRTEGHSACPMSWHTGSLPGTSTILSRRHDGLNWAVLINTRNAIPEKAPARLLDPLLHQVADAITEWPEGDPLRVESLE